MAEITFRGKKIFYQKTGSGPVALFVHGFGENGEVWKHQVEGLKGNFTLIVPDLPGSGRSERLENNASLEDFADALIAIMNEEKIVEKFYLFGHSMGGYITMAFVAKYPDRLQAFGLVHSSSFADTAEKIEIRRKGISFIQHNGGQAFLKTITPNLFCEETRSNNQGLVDELLKLSATISDEALIQYYEAMIGRPDRSEILKTTQLPVLFLIGRHDTVVPFDVSLRQCHLPSVSSVTLLEHSGHMGMWEESVKTTESLSNFLITFSRNK